MSSGGGVLVTAEDRGTLVELVQTLQLGGRLDDPDDTADGIVDALAERGGCLDVAAELARLLSPVTLAAGAEVVAAQASARRVRRGPLTR